MGPHEKTSGNRYQGVKLPAVAVFAALFCLTGSFATADIYRFVTIDGIETFTDAPADRNARIVIKDRAVQAAKKPTKKKTEHMHEVSLNEIAEKTVNGSLNRQDSTAGHYAPRLPPVGGNITSGTGMRIDPIDGRWRQHNGIDIALPEGTPITPAAPGIIVYSGLRSDYGSTVIVEHDNGLITLYAHNSRLLAHTGQKVDFDTAIALSGNSGRSTGPHLHFEAWQTGLNVTQTFMPDTMQNQPIVRLSSVKTKSHFRKEILADGSILFTNIPASSP